MNSITVGFAGFMYRLNPPSAGSLDGLTPLNPKPPALELGRPPEAPEGRSLGSQADPRRAYTLALRAFRGLYAA